MPISLAAVTTRTLELTPAWGSAPARLRATWRASLIALAVAVLFFVYWRESLSAAANSDSAASALQAWDMLHGNVLLHGWWMSDVSFYSTELPQYALLELVGGFGTWVVHVAAAMTYTLIVVLAALLAKGRSSGREGLARALLAAGIAMSPQVSGALIMLLGPDHTGTVVPVLAMWLYIDRARPSRFVPPVVCLLLTWIMVADSVVLFTGIVPLVAAGVGRAFRPHAERRHELSLAAAAVLAAGLGTLIPKVMVWLGGYQVYRFQTRTMPLARLPHDAWDMAQAVLELFGANEFEPHSPVEAVLVGLHVAGVMLALGALVVAVRRFFREDTILVPALAVSIVVALGAYLISIHSRNLASIREIVAVMPFGAVLAGRLLAVPLLTTSLAAWRRGPRLWLVPVAAVVVAGYLGAMVYGASRPAVPSANQGLATWLEQHGLRDGLAAYWEAGSVTLDTGGRVAVSGVITGRHGRVIGYNWETDLSEYDPSRHTATFVVTGGPAADVPLPGLDQAARRTFGAPDRVYRVQSYTVLVWTHNLLRDLR